MLKAGSWQDTLSETWPNVYADTYGLGQGKMPAEPRGREDLVTTHEVEVHPCGGARSGTHVTLMQCTVRSASNGGEGGLEVGIGRNLKRLEPEDMGQDPQVDRGCEECIMRLGSFSGGGRW